MSSLQLGQPSIPYYEFLRYFFPGFIFISLIFLIYKDFNVTPNDLALIFTISLISGVVIHSFSPYKYVPGISGLGKEFVKKLPDIILGNFCRDIPMEVRYYISQDIIYLVTEKNFIIRRYFALGALKLDIAFFLILTIPLILLKIIYEHSIFILFILSILIYSVVILIDDGKNDLVRSYNMMFIMYNIYNDKIEALLNKIKCDNLIIYKKKRIYPKLPKLSGKPNLSNSRS
ncbi:MAG: hypothetical protein F7C38_01180 [Desulfurococcales archaeon]|nr:hypothetical protein [Desulfurococcales archaeon]